MQVNILEAKNQLSKLIKAAEAGEEIIIANRGVPKVRLVPTGSTASISTPSAPEGDIIDWLEEHPLPAHARRSHDEIEEALGEEREAWD